MCCQVTLTVLLKIEIAPHIHSFVFHNEQKNQDISPSSTAADYYWKRTKQAKFHTSKSIFIDFMLQKWKLTKINFTKPHENITYKGMDKANAQHHKAICNRYYICYNTDNPWNHKHIS